MPGNTEDNILSFPNLKGFVFLPLPTPLRRTKLVFCKLKKKKRQNKQLTPKQQAHFCICKPPSNRKPEQNSTNVRPQWRGSKTFANLNWATGILKKTKLSYTGNTEHKYSTTDKLKLLVPNSDGQKIPSFVGGWSTFYQRLPRNKNSSSDFAVCWNPINKKLNLNIYLSWFMYIPATGRSLTMSRKLPA